MTITLFLLGKKGLVAIQHLLSTYPDAAKFIHTVVIGMDAGVVNDYCKEVEQVCIKYQLNYTLGHKISAEATKADYGIAIGWRWLIDVSNFHLIVFHDSLLPKYRGFNPLVTALIEGDTEVGVTALKGAEDFDTGDIIEQLSTPINYPIKIADAIEKVAELYGQLLITIVDHINANSLKGSPQNHHGASYSIWRNDEDYAIDWNDDATRIQRFIDSVGFPYAHSSTHYDGRLIRVVEAQVIADLNIINRVPGKILMIKDNKPVVVCGQGLLQLNLAVYDDTKAPVVFKKLRVKLQ